MGDDMYRLNIKAVRKAKHITQKELADKAGVGLNTLIRLEKPNEDCYISTLTYIAQALDVPIEQLFEVEK